MCITVYIRLREPMFDCASHGQSNKVPHTVSLMLHTLYDIKHDLRNWNVDLGATALYLLYTKMLFKDYWKSYFCLTYRNLP